MARVEAGAGGRGGGRGGKALAAGTLVVCPLSLIGQWREEIEGRTQAGALSVLFHYGADRTRSIRDLCQYDVVLTTYGTLCKEMIKAEADLGAAEGTAARTTG
ncbi:unnamed protein product, partial [Choristocarpus tenellus]